MLSNSLRFSSAKGLPPAVFAAKPDELVLDVLAGIHHGVRTPIAGESCTIGASADCDLVLADRDIADEHLQMNFYGNQVAVNAIGGTVVIEGRPALKRGYGCRVNLPLTITLGDAKLRIARSRATGPVFKRWGPYAAVIVVALVMMPIVAVQAGISGLLPQEAVSADDQLVVGSLPTTLPEPSDADVVGTLRQQLAEAGLGHLTVSAEGRHIDVSGQVPPDRLDDWRDMQRRFDQSHGGRFMLISMVSAAGLTDAPRFVFQAVFLGDNPYVVDARGERRYPGAALQDGWMLKSIENGSILVVRGGQEFKLIL